MSIYDVNPNELIEKVAEELKNIEAIQPPEWAAFVKTGAHKERPPEDKEWWYKRAAAVLRSISILGPIGVSKLRTKYGGRKNRGVKPDKFKKGSGSVIRKVLQQLDKAELSKFVEKGVHKGRIVTPKGLSLLDKAANKISKSKPKKQVEAKAEKKQVEKKAPQPVEAKKEQPVEKPAPKEVAEKPKQEVEEKKEQPVEKSASKEVAEKPKEEKKE